MDVKAAAKAHVTGVVKALVLASAKARVLAAAVVLVLVRVIEARDRFPLRNLLSGGVLSSTSLFGMYGSQTSFQR